jgi:hypothetical protein
MQRPDKPSQRILFLIDGYPSESGMQGSEGDLGRLGPVMHNVMTQLDRWPGRWAVVRELIVDPITGARHERGIPVERLEQQGYEVARLNRKGYARKPLKGAPPLSDLVAKKPALAPIVGYPEVTPDEFGWTRDEINDALATAKSWLFPTEGTQAA